MIKSPDLTLLEAVENNNYDLVKLLVNNGTNDILLRIAVDNDNYDIAKLLIENGSNVNKDNPLQEAVKNKNIDMVKLLLDNGANVNNNMSLQIAVERGYLAITKLLLSNGANVHIKNLLPLAVENNNLEMVMLLANKGVNIHADNNIALQIAAEKGYLYIIEFLLDRGANIHVNGDYPLEIAAKKDYLAVVELLLDRGATIKENIYNYSKPIQEILNTYYKVYIPLVAPFSIKTTQEIITDPNYVSTCNIGNDFEGVEVLDPILLEPIPTNLLITVTTRCLNNNDKNICSINKSTCFNAQSLWDWWITQTKNEELNNRYASNPLNKEYFTSSSIIYLQSFLQNMRIKQKETVKIIKNHTLYQKILKMIYFDLKYILKENLFPHLSERDIYDDIEEITNVYRVSVLDLYRTEGKL